MRELPFHLFAVKDVEAGKILYCGAATAANAATFASTSNPEVREIGFSEMKLRMGPAGANLVISAINSNWRVDGDRVGFTDSALGHGIVERRLKNA